MTEKSGLSLSGVPETSLAALYWRAVESQRPDALLRDERAVALVKERSLDFDRVRRIPMNELLYAMRMMLAREMDRYARDFLRRHPEAVVVQLGCGLDSRFERVDNGRVEWYDLDVPDIIELRRKFIGREGGRYHLLSSSAFEGAWLGEVKVHSPRPFLFLAETVLVYFQRAQVKRLMLNLREHFPGAELVFDAWKPFEIWLGNRYIRAPFAGLMHWGVWRAREIEGWADDIRLLDEWGFFDRPEPRLGAFRWMAPLFHLLKPVCIYRFRLGGAPG